MSHTAQPITASSFALALDGLPLETLHAKAAELRNSIRHMEASNEHLQAFAARGDQDCVEALGENRQTMGRMEERIGMIKVEVQRRGFLWDEGMAGGGAEGNEEQQQPLPPPQQLQGVDGADAEGGIHL